jgi:hypothetical protein
MSKRALEYPVEEWVLIPAEKPMVPARVARRSGGYGSVGGNVDKDQTLMDAKWKTSSHPLSKEAAKSLANASEELLSDSSYTLMQIILAAFNFQALKDAFIAVFRLITKYTDAVNDPSSPPPNDKVRMSQIHVMQLAAAAFLDVRFPGHGFIKAPPGITWRDSLLVTKFLPKVITAIFTKTWFENNSKVGPHVVLTAILQRLSQMETYKDYVPADFLCSWNSNTRANKQNFSTKVSNLSSIWQVKPRLVFSEFVQRNIDALPLSPKSTSESFVSAEMILFGVPDFDEETFDADLLEHIRVSCTNPQKEALLKFFVSDHVSNRAVSRKPQAPTAVLPPAAARLAHAGLDVGLVGRPAEPAPKRRRTEAEEEIEHTSLQTQITAMQTELGSLRQEIAQLRHQNDQILKAVLQIHSAIEFE